MAIDPIATYGARLYAKDGFRMSGDQNSGLKVTVRYLVDWENVYLFLNSMVNPINQVRVGLVTYIVPYRLPSAVAATPVYPVSFDIQPVGVREDAPRESPPFLGMAATDGYYRYAIVTINFEQSRFKQDEQDDPQDDQQLDRNEPILMCEQSVKYSSRMQTQKGRRYRYESDGAVVDGDFAQPTTGAELTLKFPRVPYQPWSLVLPYLNKVNENEMFLCGPETLLMKPPDTQTKQSMIGSSVAMEQTVTITFQYEPNGWNKLPRSDGTYDSVVKSGGGGIYEKVDFRPLFQQLQFREESAG